MVPHCNHERHEETNRRFFIDKSGRKGYHARVSKSALITLAAVLCLSPAMAAIPPTEDLERHPVYEPQGQASGDVSTPRVQSGSGLHLAAAALDARFDRDYLPAQAAITAEVTAEGWRGERVNMQAVIWAEDEGVEQLRPDPLMLTSPNGQTLEVAVSFLRYTAANGKLYAEIIDSSKHRHTLPAGTSRPLWLSVQIPQGAEPGNYSGTLKVRAAGGKEAELPVSLTVQPATLPSPAEWGVHLDIWQHPHAVARWHGVEPWCQEHMALLRPYMKRLADAGQKVISCSLIDEAWNEQTYDAWPSMVQWVKGADGHMRYDYRHFDQWVELMMELGIREQISCYTMLPWHLKIRYHDEATGEDACLQLVPEDATYEEIWAPFLKDFREHLRQKGWLHLTCIAIDERPDAHVLAAMEVIHKHAPELRVASAVNSPSRLSAHLHDMSPILTLANYTPDLLQERKAAGSKSTFYVCLYPLKPNTFTFSPPAEAEWLGLFAAANHLDGFLRWAYNSWNRNPYEHTNFVKWPAGDCWLVYPGNHSSVHFERLRDGMEDFEKIALLRRAAGAEGASPALKAAVQAMDDGLKQLFTVERSQGNEHAEDLRHAHELIEAAAALLR